MVRRVPRGRVATYGHIAALCGKPRAARTVGWALHALPEDADVPWQRIINVHGEISIGKVGIPPELQRALLEREGVKFDLDGRVDFARWGWLGPGISAEAATEVDQCD
ncbi:MAG: MGMT family protein [Gemmatimonadetes bacterium]|nr:MGMT family protein [Gemmatimonadota bacterium]